MKRFKNIAIIGTSHVAEESIKNVKAGFKEVMPDIVAVELDNGRLHALRTKMRRPKNLDLLRAFGLGGFLFYIIGELVQKKIGKIVNIEPGSEMLKALELAEKNNSRVALIDRDIQITMRRFSKNFRKRELLSMLVDMVKPPIKELDFDPSKIPSDEVVERVILYTKKRYPSLHKTLVDERDVYMARQLHKLNRLFPDKKILAVMGAGHVNGVLSYLNKENFTT